MKIRTLSRVAVTLGTAAVIVAGTSGLAQAALSAEGSKGCVQPRISVSSNTTSPSASGFAGGHGLLAGGKYQSFPFSSPGQHVNTFQGANVGSWSVSINKGNVVTAGAGCPFG